jgi:hypothetical protein
LRAYVDTSGLRDAAQFQWDENSETLKKNGQWLRYSTNFSRQTPYQLLLRARNNIDANFKLAIYTPEDDTVYLKDVDLPGDFTNLGGGNEQTDWFLSNFPVNGPWGRYFTKFDWYDHIGEPGIFGEFSFVESDMDVTPPGWLFVSIGDLTLGNDIVVMTDEDAIVYLVPDGTAADTASIFSAAAASVSLSAFKEAYLATSDLPDGEYMVYALDSSMNISEGIGQIFLTAPVASLVEKQTFKVTIKYDPLSDLLRINCSGSIQHIELYDITGVFVMTSKPDATDYDLDLSFLESGLYVMRITDSDGNDFSNRILIW